MITKIDLAEAVGFDWAAALANIQAVRPGMRTLGVSAKTGAGMTELLRAARGGAPGGRGARRRVAHDQPARRVRRSGFFLGMRHATDPDHVIAVTTIVSRHRPPVERGADRRRCGAWATRSRSWWSAPAIILLGWVIPPRVGLSLELSVGIMLIVLGVMNLSGVLQRITETVTPDGRRARARSTSTLTPHGDYVHTHVHGHEPEAHPHDPEQTPLARLDRWLGAPGLLSGGSGRWSSGWCTGSPARRPWRCWCWPRSAITGWSIVYLLVFGVGTIVGHDADHRRHRLADRLRRARGSPGCRIGSGWRRESLA